MRLPWIMTLAAIVSFSTLEMAPAAKLKNNADKVSYSIGVDLGKNFKKQGIKFSPKWIFRGLKDAMNNKGLKLSDKEMTQVMQRFQKNLMKQRLQEISKKAVTNEQKGVKFLAQNKSKSGVVTRPSGLQYKVLHRGKGVQPKLKDFVTVEYTGRLVNGTVFDSTEKHGRAAKFRVNEVIPGWTEALQLMKKGASWEIYVPAKLAYGSRGAGGHIGPNETLIFHIHLVDVKGK